MKTNIFFVIIFLIAISGCIKDEGNYDYIDLNEVQEVTGINDFYSISKFEDTLRIQPAIKFKMEENGEYTYQWILKHWDLNENIDRESSEIIISNEKRLEFVADHLIPFKTLFGEFKIINSNTEVVHIEKFEVRVQNAYQYGYFFLCEDDNDAEMFLIRPNGKTIDNLYEVITGQQLTGKPYQMESVDLGYTQNLVVFTNEGPDYGAVLDFEKLDYKWPAIKCFHNGEVGDDMVVNFLSCPSRDVFAIINGHYYYTSGMLVGDYKPYIGINVPDLQEKADLVSEVSWGVTFLHGISPGTIYSIEGFGAYAQVKIDGEPLVLPGKCFCMAGEPGGYLYGSGVDTHVIVQDDMGQISECVFNAKMDFSSWSNVYVVKQKREFIAPELIKEDTRFINSYSERYFYFSSENKIYRYNYDAPDEIPVVFAELPASQRISFLYMDYKVEGWSNYDDKFIVASYDQSGKTNGSIYFLNLDGSIDTAYEHVCGKIVDLEVKK